MGSEEEQKMVFHFVAKSGNVVGLSLEMEMVKELGSDSSVKRGVKQSLGAFAVQPAFVAD